MEGKYHHALVHTWCMCVFGVSSEHYSHRSRHGLVKENVHTRTLGVRVPCYGCVCMCVRLYITFVYVRNVCVNVCVGAFVTLYLCKNKPVGAGWGRLIQLSRQTLWVSFFFFFLVYSVWMLSGQVGGSSCCSNVLNCRSDSWLYWAPESRAKSCNLKVWF